MLSAKTTRLSRRLGLPFALAVMGAAFAALPAHAQFATTVNGNFAADDQNYQYKFTVPTTQTVYIFTTSYAGGINADGTISQGGGFDPLLTLFDSTGTELIANDDDINSYNHPDPETGKSYDAYFQTALNPGTYTLAVTEYDNSALGSLASGFSEDGKGNFTGALFGNPDGSDTGKPFFDSTGDQNSGHFAFSVSSVPPPAVPEASTTVSLGVMLALGGGGLALTSRKRKASAK